MSKRLIARGESACHYCGEWGWITADHIVPKVLGGSNARWNIIGSCQRCNSIKADSMPTCVCAKCRNAVFIWDLKKTAQQYTWQSPLTVLLWKD